MTAEAAEEQDDARARLVSAFLSGVRSGTAHAEDLRWSREYTEHVLALCDRIEKLGLPAGYLVVKLCRFGRHPLSVEEAVATVEAVCRPATE